MEVIGLCGLTAGQHNVSFPTTHTLIQSQYDHIHTADFCSQCADSASFDPCAVGQSGFLPHFHCYIVQMKNHPINMNEAAENWL